MIETDWEAGQALIKCYDEMYEQEKDLRDAGYRKLANVVREARFNIGDAFNALGSHDFNLRGNNAARVKRKRRSDE